MGEHLAEVVFLCVTVTWRSMCFATGPVATE